MKGNRLVSWGIFVLLALIWGSSFILMKRSAQHLSGVQIGAVRILAAGLLFFPFAIFHVRHIPLKKIGLVFLSAVLGNLLPAFLFAVAIEKQINSSLASILNSLTPLFVVVIGILFFRKSFAPRKLAGVLIGFAGLVALNLLKEKIDFTELEYTLLILIATIMYGFNVNMVSLYLKGLNPVHVATVSLTLVGIPAAIVAWQQNVFVQLRYDSEASVSITIAALLGVVGTAIATVLFYQLIKKAGPLFASLVTYVIPVVSIIIGVWDGEVISLNQIACLLLILGGVYLANR